jgi:hypothetical protein
VPLQQNCIAYTHKVQATLRGQEVMFRARKIIVHHVSPLADRYFAWLLPTRTVHKVQFEATEQVIGRGQ